MLALLSTFAFISTHFHSHSVSQTLAFAYLRTFANMPKVEMPNMSGKTIGKGQFKLLSPIGRGSFGTVYNALDMSTKPPTLRAVKVVRKLTQRANNQLREIVFHNGVSDHENVVTFYHAFQDARYLYIVLDFCPGGDMWGAIAAGEYWKNDELCRKVFLKLIDALEHCHRKGIYHRDLKPNNILVGEEAWEVYLSDFGLASPGKISQSFGVGTTQFRSPGELYSFALFLHDCS